MATDSEEPSIASFAQRLEAAKRQLEEQQNGTTGHAGLTRPGSRKAGSGSEALDGAIRSVKTRTPATATGDGNHSGSSRNDEGALGNKRKGNSGYSPRGGRTPRDPGAVSQVGRQNAWEASLLKRRLTKSVKRALTYAGFDLQGDARALTKDEQTQLKPHVAAFMQRVGIALDWAVTHTNRNHSESEIWMFDDEEAEKLADIYLKRARKIGWMAEVARQVQHFEDIGDAGEVAAIFGKRIAATGMFYMSNGGLQAWL